MSFANPTLQKLQKTVLYEGELSESLFSVKTYLKRFLSWQALRPHGEKVLELYGTLTELQRSEILSAIEKKQQFNS